jgi:hypothetical protein
VLQASLDLNVLLRDTYAKPVVDLDVSADDFQIDRGQERRT